MIVGIVKESFPDEARVAMVPALVPQLAKAGIEVVIESGAGADAGFLDKEYSDKEGRYQTHGSCTSSQIKNGLLSYKRRSCEK